MMTNTLPAVFEPFRENIEKSVKPFVRIYGQTKPELSVFESHFGGKPYWPKEMPYPTNADGQPLYLLAQINLAEAPALPELPNTGILQFFVDTNDDMYGLDFDNRTANQGFRVVYFVEPVQDNSLIISDFSLLEEIPNKMVAIPAAMQFELRNAPVSACDYSFEAQIGQFSYDFFEALGGDKAREEYDDLSESAGHKLGGYPYFTQEDPRFAEEETYILLFQADTDGSLGLMWGDMGIANFFIKPEDLANRDFSKVYFNWDCA